MVGRKEGRRQGGEGGKEGREGGMKGRTTTTLLTFSLSSSEVNSFQYVSVACDRRELMSIMLRKMLDISLYGKYLY